MMRFHKPVLIIAVDPVYDLVYHEFHRLPGLYRFFRLHYVRHVLFHDRLHLLAFLMVHVDASVGQPVPQRRYCLPFEKCPYGGLYIFPVNSPVMHDISNAAVYELHCLLLCLEPVRMDLHQAVQKLLAGIMGLFIMRQGTCSGYRPAGCVFIRFQVKYGHGL